MKRGSSNTLLLDINVLLALAWPNHQFHEVATRRLERSRDRWATCALTELGFIRLSSNPVVVGVSQTPADAASLLVSLLKDPGHVYFNSLPSPTHTRMPTRSLRVSRRSQVRASSCAVARIASASAERNGLRLVSSTVRRQLWPGSDDMLQCSRQFVENRFSGCGVGSACHSVTMAASISRHSASFRIVRA